MVTDELRRFLEGKCNKARIADDDILFCLETKSMDGLDLGLIYSIDPYYYSSLEFNKLEFFGYLYNKKIYTTHYHYYSLSKNQDNDWILDLIVVKKDCITAHGDAMVDFFERELKAGNLDPIELSDGTKKELESHFKGGIHAVPVENQLHSIIMGNYEFAETFRSVTSVIKWHTTGKMENVDNLEIRQIIRTYLAKYQYLKSLEQGNLAKDKTVIINRLLKECQEKGYKSVSISFDFGYTQVQKKLSLGDFHSFYIEGSYNKTSDFEKTYFQAFSMKKNDMENFWKYVTLIKRGREVLYEGTAEITHQNENQLCFLLRRLEIRDCNDQIIQFIQSTEFDKDVLAKRDLLLQTAVNWYSNKATIEALMNIGCVISDSLKERCGENDNYYSYRGKIKEEIKTFLLEKNK